MILLPDSFTTSEYCTFGWLEHRFLLKLTFLNTFNFWSIVNHDNLSIWSTFWFWCNSWLTQLSIYFNAFTHMLVAEYRSVKVFSRFPKFLAHRLPTLNQLSFNSASNMVASPTILEVTLYTTAFCLVTSLAIQSLPEWGNFPCNPVFIIVREPDFRCPVNAVNVYPAAISQLFHHSIDIRTQLALYISALNVPVMC